MARSLERYSHDFWDGYRKRRVMLMDYARALHEAVEPSSVVDIGCGPGWMIEWWVTEKPEVRVIGYDKLAWDRRKDASEEVVLHIYPGDVGKWRIDPPGGKFDLAICVNVDADIEERDHEILARGLMALAPTIFFSPSSEWWVDTFARTEGYRPSGKLLKKWREAITDFGFLGHGIRDNAQIFVRPDA